MHCEVLLYAERSAFFDFIFLLSKYSPGTSFSSTSIFLFLRVNFPIKKEVNPWCLHFQYKIWRKSIPNWTTANSI